jgi:hypothetical protein
MTKSSPILGRESACLPAFCGDRLVIRQETDRAFARSMRQVPVRAHFWDITRAPDRRHQEITVPHDTDRGPRLPNVAR